ncbi:MAG: family 16 glycoside hydrolase [Bacteroidia bacterium]
MKSFIWLGILAIFALGACKSADSSPPPPPPPPKVLTSLDANALGLADLTAFNSPTINWQVVGAASAPWDQKVEAFNTVEGTGILVNHPTEEAGGALRTQMEHGDIELSFDFMMPKGSNSGVYLQGRYEIQLLDSWGKTEVSYGDCGGIYERWDDTKPEGEKGFEGTAPSINASRAPGLWQNMKIRFQAPRFDSQGKKIQNAIVLSVIHNGKQIHRDVELSGPTRGLFFDQEAAMGPIIIQGDHGPVAFRNIEYKLYGLQRARFEGLKYAYYEIESDKGSEDYLADFDLSKLTAAVEGPIDSISRHQAARRDDHILHYTGKLSVPEQGKYLFKAQVGGGYSLKIDGEEVLLADGERSYNDPATYGVKTLTAGPHEFSLTYLQNHRFWRNGLGLWMEGPGIDFQPLHAEGSVPPYRAPSPLWIETTERPKLIRGFMMFGDQKLTHTAAIGSPEGVHFSYDLNQAKLLHAWRGPFLDVSPMWEGRGESQLSVPGGATVTLSGKASFVMGKGSPKTWPDSLGQDFKYLGYDLDRTGMPSFRYGVAGGEITDMYTIDQNKLVREISSAGLNKSVIALLMEADEIEDMGAGMFALDKRSYYLKVIAGDVKLEESANRLVHNLSSPVKYELIW